MPPPIADPFQDSYRATSPSPRPSTDNYRPSGPRRDTVPLRSGNANMSMAEALQEVVTIKPSRPKPSKAMTSTGASPTSSRPRAHHMPTSLDSVESSRRGESSNRTSRKKTSRHRVDIIDQLDPSGLSLGTFHHAGPFDALAPSRNNRSDTKSPMRAFNDSDAPAASSDAGDATLTRDALRHARKNSNSPYDVAAVYTGHKLVGNNPNYNPQEGLPKSPPKSALAEAWGRADPEPFEEFSAGGYSAHANPSTTSHYPTYGDMEDVAGYNRAPDQDITARNTRRNMRKAPPPQPIILPDISCTQTGDNWPPTPTSISPQPNGQGKGLINRFRRKNTVPRGETGYSTDVGGWYDRTAPSLETAGAGEYMVIADARDPPKDSAAFREKALPILPSQGGHATSSTPVDIDYFSNAQSGESDEAAAVSPGGPANGGGGVRRKTSLYKKVKGLGAKVASR